MADKTIADKYKLRKNGLANRNSKKTRDFVSICIRANRIINESGKEYFQAETRRFGK